jgi:hypothetical protein
MDDSPDPDFEKRMAALDALRQIDDLIALVADWLTELIELKAAFIPVALAVPDALREAPQAPAARLSDGKVPVTVEELVELRSRQFAWPGAALKFRPWHSPGQRLVIAILQVACDGLIEGELQQVLNKGRAFHVVRARKVAMRLLATQTTLQAKDIAVLFRLTPTIVSVHLKSEAKAMAESAEQEDKYRALAAQARHMGRIGTG